MESSEDHLGAAGAVPVGQFIGSVGEGQVDRNADHLGHRNIAHTERYTELCPDRSARLWDD